MTSYAEMIDYDAQFTELARRGILFSEQDKKLFREICTNELKQWDGGATVTTNLGATLTGGLEYFFKLLQELFSGKFDFNNLGSSLSSATTVAGDTHNEFMANRACINIYQEFKERGGNFALAAELVTGQKPVTSADGAGPENMPGNIYSQLQVAANIPPGTKASLNKGPSV